MKHVAPLLLSFVFASCTDTGTVLEITGAPIPSTTCAYQADSTANYISGYYDPAGIDGFSMVLSIRNNMVTEDDNIVTGANSDTIRNVGNNVVITGFDTCWYRADLPKVEEYGSFSGGVPDSFECDNLPDAQKTFAPSSGLIPAGGGSGIASFPILTYADLQAADIFGAGFHPDAIDAERVIPFDTNFDGDTDDIGDEVYSLLLTSPYNTGSRDANWGNYPASYQAQIVTWSRAVGRTQTGSTVRSGWFNYNIDICLGCTDAACGYLVKTDVTPADTTDDLFCITGEVSAISGCRPYQGGEITCEEFTTCDLVEAATTP